MSTCRVLTADETAWKMDDEDNDVDVESDFDDEDEDGLGGVSTQFMTPAERRAHHNALERKRRDCIKESFTGLREAIPALKSGRSGKNGSSASRAQILQKATEYIEQMKSKNYNAQRDISNMKMKNQKLEQQIRLIERDIRAKSPPNDEYPAILDDQRSSTSESSGAEQDQAKPRKKMKTSAAT